VHRLVAPVFRQSRRGLGLVPLVLLLAGCGSGGGSAAQHGSTSGTTTPQQANAALESASKTVQSAMTLYLAAVGGCGQKPSAVVCLEAADRTLGGKIHAYANLLARREPATTPRPDLTTALNSAQTLANSLEILGDAQPTQANYNQVLNTFDVNAAITKLQGDVATLRASLGT
jgi:hypothetical protein